MVFALQGLTPEQLASYFGGMQYYDPSAGGGAEISIEMMQQMHVRIFLHVGSVAALQGQGEWRGSQWTRVVRTSYNCIRTNPVPYPSHKN